MKAVDWLPVKERKEEKIKEERIEDDFVLWSEWCDKCNFRVLGNCNWKNKKILGMNNEKPKVCQRKDYDGKNWINIIGNWYELEKALRGEY